MDRSSISLRRSSPYVILPVMIFCARICDVTMGTIRVIFISKGIRYLAPVIGFFEVIIWLLAIGQVMNNLTNAVSYIAYGAGFADRDLHRDVYRGEDLSRAYQCPDYHQGGPDGAACSTCGPITTG